MAERRYTALQALDIFMNLESSDDSTGSDTSMYLLVYYIIYNNLQFRHIILSNIINKTLL